MNKDKLKMAIGVAVVLLITFYFVVYKKPQVTVEEPVGVPAEEVVEDNPVSEDNSHSAVKDDKKVLFDAKMKEASGYFIKGDYSAAGVAYNQALTINKNEYAYAGLYSANLALKDYTNAEKAILSAIKINPGGSDYWSWYLVLLQDAMKAPKSKIEAVYNEALNKVLDNKKINIVTQYARTLENLGDYNGAIGEWQKAITLNPGMKDVYQKEIDSLKARL